MKALMIAAFVFGSMAGALAVEAKNDLALKMSGHDSFMLIAKCLSTGP